MMKMVSVGEGTHSRYIVNADNFMKNLGNKIGLLYIKYNHMVNFMYVDWRILL